MSTSIAPPPLGDLVALADVEFFRSYPFDIFARMRRRQRCTGRRSTRRGRSPSTRTSASSRSRLTCFEPLRPGGVAVPHPGRRPTHGRRSNRRLPDAPGGAPGRLPGGRTDILTAVDPPRHTFLRKLASSAFTPRAIALLEQHVDELAVEQIDRIEPGVEMDFVDTVAAPVPMRVIAEMLGVSTDRLDDFRRWSDAFIELNDQNDPRDEAETQPVLRVGRRVQRLLHLGAAGSCRQPARRRAHRTRPRGRRRPAVEHKQSTVDDVRAARRGQRDDPRAPGERGEAAVRPSRSAARARRRSERCCRARWRSSSGSSRRSRTCAGRRSPTPSCAARRSRGATTSSCSTRRRTTTRRSGNGPRSSTSPARPTRGISRSASRSTSASGRRWRGARSGWCSASC